jgi:hypothetical protein
MDGLSDIISKITAGAAAGSITEPIMLTVDTKSGEIKQVNKDELEKMIKDQSPEDIDSIQDFLDKLDVGELEV